MALTASLSLDVTAFERGLLTADTELRTFAKATKTMERDLERLLEGFSGEKIKIEADKMAKAVFEAGGAARLTDSEMMRVNATVTEAIAKYQALGQEAPTDLKLLQAETTKTATATKTLSGSIAEFAAGFVVGNVVMKAVDAFVSFGREAVRAAGATLDLSAKTGLTTQTIQEMSMAAKLTGTTVEAFTNAAFKLGTSLSGGGNSVVAAVEQLGLAYHTLRSQTPDEQFKAVATALSEVENVQERNTLAVQLFGKAAAEILPAITEGYDDLAKKARAAGDDQLRALDMASDALDELLEATKNEAIQWFGDLAIAIRETWNTFREAPMPVIRAFIEAMELLGVKTTELPKVQGEAAKALKASGQAAVDVSVGYEEMLRISAQLTTSAEKSIEVNKEVEASQKRVNDAVQAFGGGAAITHAEEMTRVLAALGGPLKVLPSQLDAMAKHFVAAAEAARAIGDVKLAEQYAAMAKTLSPIVQLQQRYNVTIGEFLPLSADFAQGVQEQIDVLTKLDDTLYFGILPSIGKLAQAWAPFKAAVESSIPSITRSSDELKKLESIATSRKIADGLRDLSSAFADLAQITGETDGPLSKIAELVGVMGVGATAGVQFGEGLTTLNSGGLKNATAGFVQLAAAAVSAAGAMNKATSQGSRANNVLGGAATGAAIGSAFPGIGTAVGALAGGILGALRPVKKAASEIREVILDWPKILSDATDASGRLSQGLVSTVQEMRRLGTATEAINDWVKGQAGNAISGFNAVAADGEKKWERFGEAVELANKARRDAISSGAAGPDASTKEKALLAMAEAQLTEALKQQHGAAEAAGPALQDLGIQAMASFNAALASGLSYADALKQIQPGIQSIIKAHASLGLNIDDAAVKALAMQSTLLEKNPEILAGLSGLSQGMVALGNLGLMNKDTFASMQRTAMDMYTRIQGEVAAMGGSTRDALLPMQQYLQEAAEQAKLLGVPLDANTQMLIDQSKELGIWKDKGKPPMEEMREAVLEMRDGILEMVEAIGKIPRAVTSEITTRYRTEGEPPPGTGAGGGTGGGGTGGGTTNTTQPSSPPTVNTRDGMARDTIGGTITVPVYLDGRQIAVATVPHLASAMWQRGI